MYGNYSNEACVYDNDEKIKSSKLTQSDLFLKIRQDSDRYLGLRLLCLAQILIQL